MVRFDRLKYCGLGGGESRLTLGSPAAGSPVMKVRDIILAEDER